MITEIMSLLASPVLGGITGVIGTWLTRKQELEIMKERNTHERGMLQLRSDNRIRETEAQTIADNERLEGEAFKQSQDSGSSLGNSIRSATRVVLVIYLTILMTWLAYNVHEIVGGIESLPMGNLFLLYSDIINSILYLTVTAVCWYFGQRPTSTFKITGNPIR